MLSRRTTMGSVKSRAGMQASANTETQSGTVTKLYTDTLGNVIAADVRLHGIPQPLVRVDNASGTKLWQGAGVTVNWSRGSRFAPYILGAGGAEAGAVLATASAAAEDAALSSDTSGALDLTGLPLFIASQDEDVPDGFLIVPGPNVFMDDVGATQGSGGTVINGKRTISVRPLVLLSLPSGSNYPDGTLVDLVDSNGNALGMYRWDVVASTWRRRDVPSSGGGGGSFGPQSVGTFYAGPVYGADALPGFRAFSTASDLPNLSVTGVKLATGAVGTLNIADGAVTGNKLENTGITAGDYSLPTLTVDAKGRITAIANGSGSGGGSSSSGPLAVRTIGYSAQSNSLTSADDVIEAIDNNNVPTLNLPAPGNLTRKAYYFCARGAAGLNLVTTQNNTIHLSQGQSLVLVPGSDAFYDQFGAAATTSSTSSGPLAHRQIYAGTSTLTTNDDIIEAVENTGTRPILNLPTTANVTRKFYTILVSGQAGLQIGSGVLLANGATLVLLPLPDGTWRIIVRNDGTTTTSAAPDYRQNVRVITGQSTYQVQDDDEVLICRVGTSNSA